MIGQISSRELVALLRPEFQVPDTGLGVPAYNAEEGREYWDITNNNLYINNDGTNNWTLIGGAAPAVHQLLDNAWHTDTVTNTPPARGSMIVANATPLWDELGHPGALYHLQTDAADVVWAQDITMADDTWIGIAANDIRIEFDQTDGDIMAILGDAAGSDEFQVKDSGNVRVSYIDSDGNAWFDANVAIGAAVNANYRLRVEDSTTTFAGADFYGIRNYHKKTAGASTNADDFFGQWNRVDLDQVGATIGNMYGIFGQARLDDGNVGDGAAGKILYGMRFTCDLNGGKVWSDARALDMFIDQEAANEVVGSLYGIFVFVDADGTVGGDTYLMRLQGASNVDYGIYQTGVTQNYLQNLTSIGGTVAPGAMLRVDQGGAAAAIPAVFIDQGHATEQHIVISMNGADQDFPNIIQLDVTGNPAFWWDESEDAFGFKNLSGILVEDDDWIGLGSAAGRLVFDSTPAPDQIDVTDADLYFATAAHGIIHVDGVAAGWILQADGTRYVPANPTLSLPLAPVAQGDIIIADAVPAWSILTLGAAAGYALVSTATTAVWSQTPTWTGTHSFADGITFTGASNANEISIPDNVAVAFEIEEAGGIEYLRIVSTDAQPIILFNANGVDVDFHIEANGVADALQVQGSDGQITLGALGVGYVSSDAAGVLSTAALPGGFTGFGAPALTLGVVNAVGVATTAIQTDASIAVFDVNVPTTIQADDAAAAGVIAFAARRDHTHGFPTVAPSDIGNANAEGTAYDFVRSDHVHNHPAGLGTDLHHAEVHVVNSTGPHAEAGLTIGHVLRASGAAAFSFAALIAADLPAHTHAGAGTGGSLVVGATDTDATAGSVFFAGAAGVIQEDNTNLFWDDGNNWLGIGTAIPAYDLDVNSAGVNQAARFTSTDAGLYVGFADNGTTNVAGILFGAVSDTLRVLNNASSAFVAFDALNSRVGIGTVSPDNPLELLSTTTPQFRITHTDATDYATFDVDGNGLLTVTTVDGGGAAGHIALMPDGNCGISTASPDAKLDISLTDATTNTLTDMLILEHIGGATAADFGTGIRFDLEDSGSAVRQAMRLGTVWQSAAAAENAEFQLWLNYNGTLYDAGVIVGAGAANVAGNQRGLRAVDWQGYRSAATQVASGAGAAIGGGAFNTSSGQNATVPGGLSNVASGNESFAHGESATASHVGSAVWGSFAATASWGTYTWTARCHGGARIYSAAGVATGIEVVAATGDLVPLAPKTHDLGSAALEWDNIYYVTANTGTSRLINSARDCPVCGQRMKRGTGTVCIMGEDADYAMVFCVGCGNMAVEEWNHHKKDYKSRRNKPPEVVVENVRVKGAGRHREVAVDFRYGDVRNSTRLGDDEIDTFVNGSQENRRKLLRNLGMREWESREENRLMQEDCTVTERQLKTLAKGLIGQNLAV